MTRRSRIWTVLAVAGLVLAAASLLLWRSAGSSYFDFGGATQRGAPALAGSKVYVGLNDSVVPLGTDRVTFESVALVGQTPPDLSFQPLLHLRADGPSIGIGMAQDLPAEIHVEGFRPLGGSEVTAADGPFVILLLVDMPATAAGIGRATRSTP